MGIEVEQSKMIRSDPEIIWDLLERPEKWSSWWRECVEARITDDRALREGSRLELVLQPVRLRKTLRPVVDLLTERKTLSLTHRSPFLQTTFAWYLVERPDATVVKVEAVANGLFPFLVTIAQQSGVVRHTVQSHLRALKRAAERMV